MTTILGYEIAEEGSGMPQQCAPIGGCQVSHTGNWYYSYSQKTNVEICEKLKHYNAQTVSVECPAG